MISGLLKPDSGMVRFDGRTVNDVPAGRRGVGFVFQNYAVFTHMTAYDNIASGLKVRRMPKKKIDEEVNKYAELLQIRHLLSFSAGKLSINDMQKVALARTMVTKPRILLLDEPLSNLDAALRNVMRAELKRIHLELGQTTVYVTHDQVEAMSLADRIAVMNFAVLQQFATPEEVYVRPKNLFVANFIGSPTMNFFGGLYKGGDVVLEEFPGEKIALPPEHRKNIEGALRGESVVLGIRPEHVKVGAGRGESVALRAEIAGIEPLGSETVAYLKPPGGTAIIKSLMDSDFRAAAGDVVSLRFDRSDLYLFDERSTDLIVKF
jgi:ABC-type sugar transport system ATPase subunit